MPAKPQAGADQTQLTPMKSHMRSSSARSLATLHPLFLLTGVLHASGGPLLPSLAASFSLSDSQSGLLFLAYFAGTSLGALLCIGHYPRLMAAGFALAAICSTAVIFAPWPFLLGAFAALGLGVGLPMSAVSLFVGERYPAKAAPILVLLNLTWSSGALMAPLIAARALQHRDFRVAYAILAVASAIAAAVSLLWLRDAAENPTTPPTESNSFPYRRAVVLFAIAAFLEVGIENTAAAWLSTYIWRSTKSSAAFAASLSALYWTGFLVSRAGSSFILLRMTSAQLLRLVVLIALGAALFLVLAPFQSASGAAMFLLGAACAPIYPLIVSGSFSQVRFVSQTRWVLAAAGVGGSILPWLTGWISARSGSIRFGVFTLPVALLLLLVLLPRISGHSATMPEQA